MNNRRLKKAREGAWGKAEKGAVRGGVCTKYSREVRSSLGKGGE